jgi:hypothetical protein
MKVWKFAIAAGFDFVIAFKLLLAVSSFNRLEYSSESAMATH